MIAISVLLAGPEMTLVILLNPKVARVRIVSAWQSGKARQGFKASVHQEIMNRVPSGQPGHGNSKLLLINLRTETTPGKLRQGQVPLRKYYRQEHVETDCQNKKLCCYWS